ncbi:MAG: hypothetical protein IJK28_05775 [Clostridia bacterium]|nr:hypothetical protein [Clostridia bacterium]
MKRKAMFCMFCIAVLITGLLIPAQAEQPQTVDLDLSAMSGTMVYAQVYNMMVDPDPYLGKMIRLSGLYTCFNDTSAGVVYHACIIPDATACCAQGIEFIWAGEHRWPDEYPAEGSTILVTGRLEIYEENGLHYLHLVDADVEWEKGA